MAIGAGHGPGAALVAAQAHGQQGPPIAIAGMGQEYASFVEPDHASSYSTLDQLRAVERHFLPRRTEQVHSHILIRGSITTKRMSEIKTPIMVSIPSMRIMNPPIYES